MHRLFHISAIAAALAGVLRLIAQFIPYVPDSAGLELLYGAIDVGFTLAMTGLVALCAPRIPWPGLVLLLTALIGVASIVGPDKTAFGIDFYLAGSAVFALSLGLAAPWLARLPGLKAPAGAWALGALAALASAAGLGAAAFAAAGLLLALGFVLAVPALWRGAAL
ncbi:MAG: hypothetical protein ACKOQM_11995 [Novosphingobium sp.]